MTISARSGPLFPGKPDYQDSLEEPVARSCRERELSPTQQMTVEGIANDIIIAIRHILQIPIAGRIVANRLRRGIETIEQRLELIGMSKNLIGIVAERVWSRRREFFQNDSES